MPAHKGDYPQSLSPIITIATRNTKNLAERKYPYLGVWCILYLMANHKQVQVAVDTGDSFHKSIYSYQSTQPEPPVGGRVLVPFGPQDKPTVGLVLGTTDEKDYSLELKPILEVIDEEPLVTPILLQLLAWSSAYYLTTFFQALRFALPHPLYGKGVEMVKLLLDLESAVETLKKIREKGAFVQGDMLEYLIGHPITTIDTLKRKFKTRASTTLKALSNKGLIKIYPLKYTYRKTVFQKAKIFYYYADTEKQVEKPFPNPFSKFKDPALPKEVQNLLETGKLFLKEVSLEKITLPKPEPEYLVIEGTPAEREALVLEKIRKAIQQGGQVLFLSSRLYHSYYWEKKLFTETGRKPLHWSEYKTLDQKLKDWEEIRLGAKKIIVGGMRSLFLPYKNLQLVVFDEIDSGNFKTFTSPRIDAKDCLEFIQANDLCSVIVTSSLETPLLLYLHDTGKYKYFRTTTNSGGPLLIIPARERDVYYPVDTLNKIKETLDNYGSVLYFQNRRGFYTVYLCRKCNYQAKCPNCQVNLVYHLKTGKLHCHTCDFSTTLKEKCPYCFEGDMVLLGVGTQRISEELKNLFQVDTLRIDADSLNEIGRREILNKLQATRPLLVVGTEAIFSFFYDYKPDFCVYGNPDLNFNLPDYLGEEVVYRNIFRLISWSSQPIHLLTSKDALDVQETAQDWPRIILEKYRNFDYPPYTRLILLTYVGADKETVKKEGNLIKSWIDREFNQTINTYLFNIKREGKYKGVVLLRGDIKISESLRLFDILKSVRDRITIIPDPSGLMTW